MSYKLKYYVGPASRYAGVKIESTEYVADTQRQAEQWIEMQKDRAARGSRDWPVRGYTYKRVRHYS